MQQVREYGLQDFVGGDFGGDFADCVGVGAQLRAVGKFDILLRKVEFPFEEHYCIRPANFLFLFWNYPKKAYFCGLFR